MDPNTSQYSYLFLSIICHSSILRLGSSAAGFMVHPTAKGSLGAIHWGTILKFQGPATTAVTIKVKREEIFNKDKAIGRTSNGSQVIFVFGLA
ncbi:hypothetical protein TSUD_194450 [Trifolium subterraneum]|uniref:Uncharacterized protein n=1 Tax=Trifolium subterraneum TaxID=3900 RepID=A0A2Z6NH39_TRISU|nr:hypothetical protein TSUD_194450 [Trifolium subterraneum]